MNLSLFEVIQKETYFELFFKIWDIIYGHSYFKNRTIKFLFFKYIPLFLHVLNI